MAYASTRTVLSLEMMTKSRMTIRGARRERRKRKRSGVAWMVLPKTCRTRNVRVRSPRNHQRAKSSETSRTLRTSTDRVPSSSRCVLCPCVPECAHSCAQIDALLPNVRPKYTKYAPLERFLLALHTFLTSLAPIEPNHPLAAARSLQKRNITVPYPTPAPTEDTNWKVAFEKPADVAIVGSWISKLSVKAQDKMPYRVDLAVEMPSVRP